MEPLTPKLILVPTDFSAPAAHALRYAAALGERFRAHLLVIYVDAFVPPGEMEREQLQTFAETNIPVTVPFDLRLITGDPATAILSEVGETGADLIVMGTHGRTGLQRLLFGSVTEAVIRQAPVPVIAVHESTPVDAPMRVIAGERFTETGRAAVEYAGMLADADNGRYVEILNRDELIQTARKEGVDLIALGIGEEHEERVVQHSNCAVLTMNRFSS
jgi:nucleotide-binding universal stress UspA family protein